MQKSQKIILSILSITAFFLAYLLIITPSTPKDEDVLGVPVNYYVSPNGSDYNPGTQTLPFKTIQKAANTLLSGDIANVAAGTYQERVNVSRPGISFISSGEATTNGFVISADNTTISGFNITSNRNVEQGYGVYVSGDNCIIKNNYIYSTVQDGILLDKTSDSCQVLNNRIYKPSQSGIQFRGTNHLIQGNDISETVQYPPEWINPPSWLDADGIRFFGSGTIVRNNYIHDINFNSQNPDPHIDCFQTWGDTSKGLAHDILFDGNKCILSNETGGSGTTKGFQIADGTYNLSIINNIIHAKLMMILDVGSSYTHSISILNNTLAGYKDDPYSWGIKINNVQNVTIRNNILAYQENGIGSIYADSKSTLSVSNNCVFRQTGLPYRPADSGDVWNQDPLFVDYLNNDFRVQSNSPCIDKGINVGVYTDIEKHSRPQKNGYDIGAYEWADSYPISTPTPWTTPNPTVTTSPTTIPTKIPTSTPIATPTTLPTKILPSSSPTPTITINPNPSTDTTPPQISILSPKAGSTIIRGSSVNINVSASDNIALSKIEYYVNGEIKCSTISQTCNWKVPKSRNQSFTILTKAYDTSNNYNISSITVNSDK